MAASSARRRRATWTRRRRAGEPLPGGTRPAPGGAAPGRHAAAAQPEARAAGSGPTGSLEQALATGAASLELEPGAERAAGAPARERPRLRFDFDEQGRLASLHGRARWGAAGPEGPHAPHGRAARAGEGAPRRVESDAFDGDARSRDRRAVRARVRGTVAFSEPGRRGLGGPRVLRRRRRARWCSRESRASSTRPRAPSCAAATIRIGTRTGAVAASGSVRHEVKGKGRRGGLFGGQAKAAPGQATQEPTVIVCREFEYDPADTQRPLPGERARCAPATDEVRAPLITLDEPGRRTSGA